jgi:hypothetical protein
MRRIGRVDSHGHVIADSVRIWLGACLFKRGRRQAVEVIVASAVADTFEANQQQETHDNERG